mgnify:CR=1 FL=1
MLALPFAKVQLNKFLIFENKKNSFIAAQSASLEEKFAQLETELKNSIIPPGFIYVQLPGEKPPQELWPKFAPWLDISPSFAGTFFRVEGGGAEPFGKVQEAFIPHLSQVNYTLSSMFLNKGETSIQLSYLTELSKPLKMNPLSSDSNIFNYALIFKWATGEVRPRNMAIKVWRRMM